MTVKEFGDGFQIFCDGCDSQPLTFRGTCAEAIERVGLAGGRVTKLIGAGRPWIQLCKVCRKKPEKFK